MKNVGESAPLLVVDTSHDDATLSTGSFDSTQMGADWGSARMTYGRTVVGSTGGSTPEISGSLPAISADTGSFTAAKGRRDEMPRHLTRSAKMRMMVDERSRATGRGSSKSNGSIGRSIRHIQDSMRGSLRSLGSKSFRFGGSACSVRHLGGTASVRNEIFNLVKNIVGCGVLSLSAGIGAFANSPSAIIPASVLILLTGFLFGYYFLLLGRLCKITMTATYREAWENSVGEAGSLIVALVNTLKATLANLAYSMILADTGRDLLRTAGLHFVTRTEALITITAVVLLPLCLLKSLKVLAPFSIVGLAGMLFTCFAMTFRFFDGTYAKEGGKFLEDLDASLQPSFGSTGASGALGPHVLVLACMLFESFVAHYNAPRFYVELRDNSVERFSVVTYSSYLISAIFFVLVASFGFLTFGENSSGMILNNYSTRDPLATSSRIFVAVAIAFTYPIIFIGTRDGVMDVLTIPVELQTSRNLNILSVVLLSIITALAASFTDLGVVNAVSGGTLAAATVFIFPTLMFHAAIREGDASPEEKREGIMNLAFMCLGVVIGAIGVVLALSGRE